MEPRSGIPNAIWVCLHTCSLLHGIQEEELSPRSWSHCLKPCYKQRKILGITGAYLPSRLHYRNLQEARDELRKYAAIE